MDAQVYLSAQTMPIDSPDSDPLRPDLVDIVLDIGSHLNY